MKPQMKYADMFKKKGRILELGSGAGDFLKVCSRTGLRAKGIDSDPAKEKGINAVRGDIHAYLRKTAAGKLDGIYARHVIEHFEPEKLNGIFRMSKRALKKGGRIILIFPNMKNINVASYEFWNDITHKRPYTGDAVAGMLEKAGYEIINRGPDRESWDDSPLKNMARFARYIFSGIKNEPPDYFIVAVKK